MEELVLTVSDDHVARIAHEGDPVRAVVELVWNSVDAEATSVSVVLERDVMGGVSAVRVEDNGHGVSADEVASNFGRIGGSWKSLGERSKNGMRRLHGQLGVGRLRAFALGARVEWVSTSIDTAGQWDKITISGSRGSRDRFRWQKEPSEAAASGTRFTAHNDQQLSLVKLETAIVIPVLRSHFAPILLKDTSLGISFDGTTLDPGQEILHDTKRTITFGSQELHEASLRIIEWRSGKHRSVAFGSDDEHFPIEQSGSGFDTQFAYSAYVAWNGLGSDELGLLGLGDMAPDPLGELWNAARKSIQAHFDVRRRERRREQVKAWQETGIYPYKGKPVDEAERAERAVFDVVSGTLVPHISKKKQEARLTLELLRGALRQDPEKLTAILHEVVALNEDDRDTLTKLLAETTLSAVIRSANMVANRHKFLVGLEHLIFDPQDATYVGERDHLHKILGHELWVFGEAYHLMSSERGLTELLRTQLHLEGLPTKDAVPVKRWDGTTGRVDLHLAAQYKEHDRIRHLVIELKAPGVTVTQKEMNQVEGYANAIRTSAAFATERSSWDFILVASDYDDLVDDRIDANYRDSGRFLAPAPKPGRPQVRAFVRKWRDVLDENQRRLEFVTSALEHDPSITEGLAYVRGEYHDLLPEELQTAVER